MGDAAVAELAGCGAGGGYEACLGEDEEERAGTPAGLVFDFLFACVPSKTRGRPRARASHARGHPGP